MPDWALAIGAGLLGWVVFGSVYAAAANLRWPASGRYVRIKGGRLHVALHDGEGPLVAALHGASANGREFAAVAAALNGKARVAAIDRPGYGHSSRPAGAASLGRQAEMLGECLDVLDPGPVIVLAHSLGCATALRLALERPDKVAGLVLVAPAANPYPGPNAWHVRLAARPIAGLLFARLAVPLVGPLLAQGAIAKTFAPAPVPKGYAGAAAVGLLFRPKTFRANAQDVLATKTEFEAQYFRYDEINAPAIVITADSDRVVSPRIHARALARVLPKAELVVTPGAGHMPHHIRPEAVTAAILRIAQIAGSESL